MQDVATTAEGKIIEERESENFESGGRPGAVIVRLPFREISRRYENAHSSRVRNTHMYLLKFDLSSWYINE